MPSRLTFALILAALLPQQSSYARHARAAAGDLPRRFVWAWERPEDLRQLPAGVGVAFLAQTIVPVRDGIRVVPRRQPLRLNPDTPLLAVTRIEVDESITLAESDASRVADRVASTVHLPRVRGVQIDFDARASDRPFYRALLYAVRGRIGERPLSMTALASWCASDNWLDGLPVDEAIPMLFRMGPFNAPFRSRAATGDWVAAKCHGSIGVSLDEPDSLGYSARRVYVFAAHRWTDGDLADARVVR